MKQQEATEQLGDSMRHVKRLLRIYRREGVAGLVSKRRGKPSNNRLPVETKQQALGLIQKQYAAFVPTPPSRRRDAVATVNDN